MKTSDLNISLAIVHYYCQEDVTLLLESLKTSLKSEHNTLTGEVIIINNGPLNTSLGFEKAGFPWEVRVIQMSKNIGFGAGVNKALSVARGETFFIANPDLVFKPGDISNLYYALHAQEKPCLLGPALCNTDGSYQFSCRNFPRIIDLLKKRVCFFRWLFGNPDTYLLKNLSRNKAQNVPWMVAAALVTPTETLKKIGGFDERFFLFFGDTDLCRRYHENGFTVLYFPEVSLVHSSSKRLSERGNWFFQKVFWIHLSSAIKYFYKWRGRQVHLHLREY